MEFTFEHIVYHRAYMIFNQMCTSHLFITWYYTQHEECLNRLVLLPQREVVSRAPCWSSWIRNYLRCGFSRT